MPEAFDFQKAITAANAIHTTFKQKRGVDMYPDQWDAFIYVFIKDALLEPHDCVFAPSNRPFLQVYVPTEEEVRFMIKEHDDLKIGVNSTPKTSQSPQEDKVTYKNFHSVAKIAYENYSGIALYATKAQEEPNMTIRFGALFSYLFYGDVGGSPQICENFQRAIPINPSNPKQAIADENDMNFEEGVPSEEFFHDFIRTCIRQELRKLTKNENLDVSFLLRQQFMYVMRHLIVLKTSEPIGDQDRINQLMQGLTWWMPIYLPLAFESHDGLIDIYS